MRPIAMRLLGAAVALLLGLAGTRWGAQAAIASVAVLAIAAIAVERRLEPEESRATSSD